MNNHQATGLTSHAMLCSENHGAHTLLKALWFLPKALVTSPTVTEVTLSVKPRRLNVQCNNNYLRTPSLVDPSLALSLVCILRLYTAVVELPYAGVLEQLIRSHGEHRRLREREIVPRRRRRGRRFRARNTHLPLRADKLQPHGSLVCSGFRNIQSACEPNEGDDSHIFCSRHDSIDME